MRGTRPLIGITCRRMDEKLEPWQDNRQGAIMTMINAVIAGGGVPLLLPIVDSRTTRELYERTDGLIMVGGGDVNSMFYDEEPKVELDRLDTDMDKWELSLASWAVLDQKPVFGICRGMQVMNVAMGGSLHQDIPTDFETSIDHQGSFHSNETAKLIHGMEIEPDSRLAKILGTIHIEVNSLHHQSLDRVANDLRVVGVAPDGVVEAAEGRGSQYVMLIQSHPEAAAASDERWQAVYSDLVKAAVKYSKSKARAPRGVLRLHHA